MRRTLSIGKTADTRLILAAYSAPVQRHDPVSEQIDSCFDLVTSHDVARRVDRLTDDPVGEGGAWPQIEEAGSRVIPGNLARYRH
jgi:hypothetical protein